MYSNSVEPSLCAKFKDKRCKKYNISKFISHKTYVKFITKTFAVQ